MDFIKTAKGMLTDEIRQELKNLDGFRFMPHSDIELPEERLNRLSEIVERQRRAILAGEDLVAYFRLKHRNG